MAAHATATRLASLAALLLVHCDDTSVTSRDATVDRPSSSDAMDTSAPLDATIADSADATSPMDVAPPSDVLIDGARDAAIADSASCSGRPFGERCADGLVCDGRGACAVRRPCTFESAGRWLYPDGAARRLLETVFAYGRYYNFWINPDGSYEPLNAGGNTTVSVARWQGATNACAGGASECTFDSFDLYEGPGAMGRVLWESITRLGRFYNYTSEGGYRLVQTGLLEEIPRYSMAFNGPCSGQVEGACRFDTRSLVVNWSTGELTREEITARGARWIYDGSGRPVASVPLGQRLDAVARYVPSDGSGPCVGRSPCRFDAQYHDPSTGDEFVVAYGRLWVWANDAENTRRFALGHGNELHTFARYATGPCRVAP
ncbi:MAG: hypothetical protein JNK05_38465 [Myxococcales bacterium]|nr:hypothetical protein [Myxococcales bacterium]